MADLFSTLAQGQPENEVVQPRLPARFEADSVTPSVDPEEAAAQQPTAASAVARDNDPVSAVRLTDSRPRADQGAPGAETIAAATSEPPHEQRRPTEQVLPAGPQAAPSKADTPGPVVAHRTPAPIQPSPGRDELSPAASEPFQSAVLPAAQAPLPTIAALPAAPDQAALDSDPPFAADGIEARSLQQPWLNDDTSHSVEPAAPPVMPAASAPEMSALDAPTRSAGEPPIIEVHIGRVELRQAPPPAPETPPARPRYEPPVSLSAYLARRSGGRA